MVQYYQPGRIKDKIKEIINRGGFKNPLFFILYFYQKNTYEK